MDSTVTNCNRIRIGLVVATLKEEYVQLDAFLTGQFETVLYSLLFGLSAGWFLF